MDISYLKNNYNLIIEDGIHYYSNGEYFMVDFLEKDKILNLQKIFQHYKGEEISENFYNKINSKLNNFDLGAFWHYNYDNSSNKLIVRIIFDNAQIYTDTSFNEIIKIKKPKNNISFKKYKNNFKKDKKLKKNKTL
tara:strand:+ start:2210 stop:2617 length:408 start_codon:yes stop_codon:yes gene_type:complete